MTISHNNSNGPKTHSHSNILVLLLLTSIVAHGILFSSKCINSSSMIEDSVGIVNKSTIPYDTEKEDSNEESSSSSIGQQKQLRSPSSSSGTERLPHWRLGTDCSMYSFDCFAVAQLENKYKDYPFLESTRAEIEASPRGGSEWSVETFGEFPSDWVDYLEKPVHTTKPEESKFVYPPKAPKEDYEKCTDLAIHQNKTTMEQLDVLFSTNSLSPEPETNMVAFTISDFGYVQDMLHDVFQMMDDVVGFSNRHFFLVALDPKSADLACQYGYSVVTWKADQDNLRDAVANTKVVLSHELVKLGMDFFFTEMDVWWIRSPKDHLVAFQKKHDDADAENPNDPENHKGKHVFFSGHQNNHGAPNIGVYAVKADEYSEEYFRICLDVLKQKPETHDQWVMAEVHRLFQHVRENRKYKFGGNFEPDGPPETPTIEHPFRALYFSPHEVVADERPTTTQLTLAIHTLNGTPLQAPHGKKMVAKELGVYYGFHSRPPNQSSSEASENEQNAAAGYYDRSGENRRYLWLDTDIRPNFYSIANWNHYHNRGMFEWTMAILMAIARKTERILVLPQVFDADMDAGTYFSWTMMDYSKVTEMIDVRETNFISNPKSWLSQQQGEWPFETIVNTGAFSSSQNHDGISIFTQVSQQSTIVSSQLWMSGNDNHPPPAFWLDAWMGSLSTVPEFESAEVLMVNPELFIGEEHSWKFTEQLKDWKKQHIRREKQSNEKSDDENEKKEIPPIGLLGEDVLEIYGLLGWCWDDAFRHTANKISASDSCYGIGRPK